MRQPLIPIARSVLITAVLATVVWVSAGSLTPPVGPVAPTMKNLSDVEPRIAIRNQFDTLTPVSINFSGSFYLAEDILALPGQHGIAIDASNVTLDLNGFTVYGNLEVGSLDGINIAFNRDNITIKNGTVRDFFQSGIYGPLSDGCIIENVRVTNNGSHGIFLQQFARVKDCLAMSNGEDGIRIGRTAVITGCISAANGTASPGSGVRVTGDAALVSETVVDGNSQMGFFLGSGALVSSCIARLHDDNFGIFCNPPGLIHGSSATGNGNFINGTDFDSLDAP